MARRKYSTAEATVYMMDFSESESVPSESESVSSDDEMHTNSDTSSTGSEMAEVSRLVGRSSVQGEATVEVNEHQVESGSAAAGKGVPAWKPIKNYSHVIPPFSPVPGVNMDTNNFQIVDFFNLFITESILQDMVLYTNRYAEQVLSQNPPQGYARAQSWYPTTVSELKKFWGLTLAMGILRKSSISSYWDTTSILATPLFPAIMPTDRYQLLTRFLHFNDNATAVPLGEPGHDSLHKIRPLIDSLSERFAEVYTPSQNVTIDESLLLFRGRIEFRQYFPSKRARNGIKCFKLTESSTGYTKCFRIYQGSDAHLDPPGCPVDLHTSGKIVWELITPLLGKGYHLYMDNYYTSVPLFRALYSLDTPACGTVNRNQKGLPRALLDKKLKRGRSYALRSKELLAVKFMDKKNVFMLTTIHDESVTDSGQRGTQTPAQKPRCIRDYNKFMGGVDKTDQILTFYNAIRKSRAWYKKVAIHLVQLATYNSFVVFKAAVPGSNLTFVKYQQQLLSALLFSDAEEIPEVSGNDDEVRLIGKHFIKCVPPTPGLFLQLSSSFLCLVCSPAQKSGHAKLKFSSMAAHSACLPILHSE
ncbi:piggyBac transposable element-derived protein 4-like [Gastrophryne carolinensis]